MAVDFVEERGRGSNNLVLLGPPCLEPAPNMSQLTAKRPPLRTYDMLLFMAGNVSDAMFAKNQDGTFGRYWLGWKRVTVGFRCVS